MSLQDVLAGLRTTVNDTIATPEFKPLNRMIQEQAESDRTYIADKATLDLIKSNIGNTTDSGGIGNRYISC